MLVVGDREMQGQGVAVRKRDTGDAGFKALSELIPWVRQLIDTRAVKW
jgi:threonyl-tRNA synthetase